MSVIVARVKEIAREVDTLLNSIRGTVELLAVSEFQEDIYHPSLRAVSTMAGRSSKKSPGGKHSIGVSCEEGVIV